MEDPKITFAEGPISNIVVSRDIPSPEKPSKYGDVTLSINYRDGSSKKYALSIYSSSNKILQFSESENASQYHNIKAKMNFIGENPINISSSTENAHLKNVDGIFYNFAYSGQASTNSKASATERYYIEKDNVLVTIHAANIKTGNSEAPNFNTPIYYFADNINYNVVLPSHDNGEGKGIGISFSLNAEKGISGLSFRNLNEAEKMQATKDIAKLTIYSEFNSPKATDENRTAKDKKLQQAEENKQPSDNFNQYTNGYSDAFIHMPRGNSKY